MQTLPAAGQDMQLDEIVFIAMQMLLLLLCSSPVPCAAGGLGSDAVVINMLPNHSQAAASS